MGNRANLQVNTRRKDLVVNGSRRAPQTLPLTVSTFDMKLCPPVTDTLTNVSPAHDAPLAYDDGGSGACWTGLPLARRSQCGAAIGMGLTCSGASGRLGRAGDIGRASPVAYHGSCKGPRREKVVLVFLDIFQIG